MNVNTSAEIHVPYLASTMPGEYSLGIPIDHDTVQVGTATLSSSNAISRLLVAGTRQQITIRRQDSAPLQVEAYDLELGVTDIFSEPVDRLVIARASSERPPDMWTPVNEGLVVVSNDGLRQFLTIVEREANHKKHREELDKPLLT